jgi:hypothetical protein
MQFSFKIKTEKVTQTAIIIGVVAFTSGSPGMIADYLNTMSTVFGCAIALAVIASLIFVSLLADSHLLVVVILYKNGRPINKSAGGIPPLGAAIPIGLQMVLHVSPVPGSNKKEEFLYYPAVDRPYAPTCFCLNFLQDGEESQLLHG